MEDALLGQNEVHDGENGLLDFACIAGAANDDFFCCVVNDDKALGIQSVALTLGLKVRCVKNGEFRLVLGQLFGAGQIDMLQAKVLCQALWLTTDGQNSEKSAPDRGLGRTAHPVRTRNQRWLACG